MSAPPYCFRAVQSSQKAHRVSRHLAKLLIWRQLISFSLLNRYYLKAFLRGMQYVRSSDAKKRRKSRPLITLNFVFWTIYETRVKSCSGSARTAMESNGGTTYQSTTVTSYNDIVKQPSFSASGEYPVETQVKSTRIVEVTPYFDAHVRKFTHPHLGYSNFLAISFYSTLEVSREFWKSSSW